MTNNKIKSSVGSGVKDQHLYLDNSTLMVTGDVNVESDYDCRNLTTVEDLHMTTDIIVHRDVNSKQAHLDETVIKNDIVVNSVQNKDTRFINVLDPLAKRDAVTHKFYNSKMPRSYNYNSVFSSPVYVDANESIPMFVDKPVNASPDASNYFTIRNHLDGINLFEAGIYHVSATVSRKNGRHGGDAEPNIFIRLHQGVEIQELCSSDTRGHTSDDNITNSLSAIFALPRKPPRYIYSSTAWIDVKTVHWLDLIGYTLSVTWYPLRPGFVEVE